MSNRNSPTAARLGLALMAAACAALLVLEVYQDFWQTPELRRSRDLVVDKALLLENGFDELNGVDWQKGCYMGQELTARTKYRGLIKRRLFPVRIEGPLPASGAPVHRNGKEVGEIRSGQGDRALAMLQIDAADGALTADGATLFPERPAWMQIPDAK